MKYIYMKTRKRRRSTKKQTRRRGKIGKKFKKYDEAVQQAKSTKKLIIQDIVKRMEKEHGKKRSGWNPKLSRIMYGKNAIR